METTISAPNRAAQAQYPLEIWMLLRKAFVQGKGNLAALCRKYGVNYATALERGQREKWKVSRQAFYENQAAAIVPPIPVPLKPVEPPPDGPLGAKVATLNAQIERIDALMLKTENVAELDKLSSAKGRLLEQWRILSGIPLPGSRRPGRTRERRLTPVAQPIEEAPTTSEG